MPLNIIKAGRNTYHVVNKNTAKQLDYKIKGGKVSTSNLLNFFKNSYSKKKEDNFDDYHLDHNLSGERFQAYYNPETNHLVTVHRGTKGMQDWVTDLRYSLGDKSSARFKHAEKMQKEAEDKYSYASKKSVVGHSLGAVIAQNNGKNADEVITLDKPVRPQEDLFNTKAKDQVDIRTERDPVSFLHGIEWSNGNEITIPSNTYNPLTEHRAIALERLDQNRLIGYDGGKIYKRKVKR